MSCFLCDSFYHLTQNCNIYVDDKSRNAIIQTKIKESSNKVFTMLSSKKCYFCCSINHNTVFCPDRFTAKKFFIPNIDHDLLSRFLAVLEPFEKFLFASQSPTTFYKCDLQLLAIIDTLKFSQFSTMPNIQTKIIICKNFELSQESLKWPSYQSFYGNVCSKVCAVYAENITFSNISLSAVTLSVLLSSRTKFFKISKVQFWSNLTLDKIFKNAPNLEEFCFEFYSWRNHVWENDEFFKYKYGNHFKRLKITVNDDDDFNVAKLMPFVNKIHSNIIKIDVNVKMFSKTSDGRQLFLQKILNCFIPAQLSDNQPFSLYLRVPGICNKKFMFAGSFALKNVFSL